MLASVTSASDSGQSTIGAVPGSGLDPRASSKHAVEVRERRELEHEPVGQRNSIVGCGDGSMRCVVGGSHGCRQLLGRNGGEEAAVNECGERKCRCRRRCAGAVGCDERGRRLGAGCEHAAQIVGGTIAALFPRAGRVRLPRAQRREHEHELVVADLAPAGRIPQGCQGSIDEAVAPHADIGRPLADCLSVSEGAGRFPELSDS